MFRQITNKLAVWKGKYARTSSTNGIDYNKKVSIPRSADVVIIGGGSAGCHALYHLGKCGINAVLLEKSKLISGTTWHTAGLVWSMRGPNDTEIELLEMTKRVLSSLEEETGMNPGWINNGGLYIAQSSERMCEYKRMITAAKAFNIDVHLISPLETVKIFPLLDKTAFKGAIYCPEDGTVDPAMLINALTKSAKQLGCEIIEECPVINIHTKEGVHGLPKVCGVETAFGTIDTEIILNASGVWSNEISKLVGLEIPLIPMKHAYIVTEQMEGVQGLPNIRDPDSSVYFKVQGGVISIGGYEPNPIVLKKAPEDFSFSLYELDWNVFAKHMDAMVKLIPKLSSTGIRTTICGPESFTPDHKPLMGEDPRCTGLYYSCGYNSAGMMLGGGCGQQIAQWIIKGRPDINMFPYDIRRFLPEQRTNKTWINERCHEAYAKNYSIQFPHDESLSGRNLKMDPFHNLLLKEGAVMEERQGWERPSWFHPYERPKVLSYDYDGYYGTLKNENDEYRIMLQKEYNFHYPPHHDIIGEEALSCRNNVALFNLSYFGKYYLCGPDVQTAANSLFISPTDRDFNRTVYTCMLNSQGGVEADCTVTAVEPGSSGIVDPMFKGKAFYIVAGGASAYQTWVHVHKVINEKKFEVSLHDATDQIGILSLQGPGSQELLQTVIEGDISNKIFPFSTAKLVRIKGELVRVFRLSYVGELGFELHIPKQSCEKVYKAVVKAGKRCKMRLAGYRALYSLSCEKGYHLWNSDLRVDDNPIEAGLGFLCKNPNNYIGKESVVQAASTGVKKKRVHFHVKSEQPMWGMETVYRDGNAVGYIRRAEYGYTFQNNIGQGYITQPNGYNVTKEFLQTGTWEVEIMGKLHAATLYLQSPFDPQNKRMMGMYND